MLKLMNRGYTRETYLELIRRAKARMPDIAIVGDMIVGYPTETDEDFEASISLLHEVRYKTVYVFKYSERPNTVAANRDGAAPTSTTFVSSQSGSTAVREPDSSRRTQTTG